MSSRDKELGGERASSSPARIIMENAILVLT